MSGLPVHLASDNGSFSRAHQIKEQKNIFLHEIWVSFTQIKFLRLNLKFDSSLSTFSLTDRTPSLPFRYITVNSLLYFDSIHLQNHFLKEFNVPPLSPLTQLLVFVCLGSGIISIHIQGEQEDASLSQNPWVNIFFKKRSPDRCVAWDLKSEYWTPFIRWSRVAFCRTVVCFLSLYFIMQGSCKPLWN